MSFKPLFDDMAQSQHSRNPMTVCLGDTNSGLFETADRLASTDDLTASVKQTGNNAVEQATNLKS